MNARATGVGIGYELGQRFGQPSLQHTNRALLLREAWRLLRDTYRAVENGDEFESGVLSGYAAAMPRHGENEE